MIKLFKYNKKKKSIVKKVTEKMCIKKENLRKYFFLQKKSLFSLHLLSCYIKYNLPLCRFPSPDPCSPPEDQGTKV